MKKKFFARALALVMSLSLLSTVAFAAPVAFDPNTHVDGSGTLLSHEETNDAGETVNSYDYYLDKDIELDKTLTIKDGANASIDLNGYTLSGNGSSSVIKVTGKDTSLTLDDKAEEATYEQGEGTGTITGGNALFGGGVNVSDGAKLTMEGGTISGNTSTAEGGGVYVVNGSTFEMNGGEISGNTAKNSGGGVFVANYTKTGNLNQAPSQFVMNDGIISGNTAGDLEKGLGNGGGVAAFGDKQDNLPDPVTIKGGTIIGNKTGGNGAGIAIQNGGIAMTGGTVSGNTGANLGGGLYVYDSSADISNATFTGNSTGANAVQGLGGGIYLNGATGTIANTTIGGDKGTDRNSATTGGGVYVGANSNIALNGNTVNNNHANGAGGGVYVYGGSVTMTGDTISGNTASQGGGIYATNGANVTMNRGDSTTGTVSITENTATNVGGGVRLHDNATFTMDGGIISDNHANGNGSNNSLGHGGGVYSYKNTTFTMNGGEISGNTATGSGGGFYNHTATFTMNDGKLYDNTAETHSDDIYNNSSATLKLPFAGLMNVTGADGKPITGWYYDGGSRYGQGQFAYYAQNHATREGGYKGALSLKAAHDQYFSVLDGENNTELANVEKGTVLDLSTIEAPQLDGYAFIGWVLGDEVVESVTVTEEITLGSLWQHVDHNTATRTENMIPAQIGVAGSYDEVTYCTVCGDELGRTTVTIPALEPEEPEIPEEPETPEDPGVIIPDPDVPLAGGPDADTATIEDEAVPLAGIVTLAEMLEELRQHEEIAEIELPEDFKFIDHDYAQALYWALAEDLVADTEEEPLDPDEIVTVGLMQKVLDSYVGVYKSYADFVVTVEGEPDEMVMDLGERLTAFYGELEQYETAAEAEAEAEIK